MIGFAKGHNLEILGEYHSHPNGGVESSDGDREYIRMQHENKMAMTSDYIVDDIEH